MSTQPLSFPWATNTNYATGPDVGQPTKIPPALGRVQDGLRRDDPLAASVYNYQLNALARGLEVMDAPALGSWSDTQGTNAGQPGANLWLYANVPAGFNRVRSAPGYVYGGVYREVLVAHGSQKMLMSYDGKRWIDRGNHGFTDGVKLRGPVVGMGPLAGVPTITILIWTQANSGVVRATDNFGTAWYLAGTLDPSFEDSITSFGAYFAGRFFACGRSQLYYHDHATLSANTAWTRIDTASLGWNGAPPVPPSCVEVSPSEIAIGITGAPSVLYSNNGIVFAAAPPLPTTPGDGVAAMHWSVAHQKWIVLTQFNDRLLSAPAGFGAWTELNKIRDYNGNVVTGPKRVMSLGRIVIVAAGSNLWVSRDLANWRALPLILTQDGTTPNTWEWMVPLNGRIWAGRPILEAASNNVEYAMSGVLPNVFADNGAIGSPFSGEW